MVIVIIVIAPGPSEVLMRPWMWCIYIYIYIYGFSRHFYPKRLTLHSSFYILSALAFPGIRTHDIVVANAMLYQLNYSKAIFIYCMHAQF